MNTDPGALPQAKIEVAPLAPHRRNLNTTLRDECHEREVPRSHGEVARWCQIAVNESVDLR